MYMKYLLLRDNKQTGPYSLEELIAKGLKPYDLVWLEGKSAAWRYPSEMPELKPYAPAVEEQPYDRFYKKPQQQSSVPENSALAAAAAALKKEIAYNNGAINENAVNGSVIEEVPVVKIITPKKIYVTLPAS